MTDDSIGAIDRIYEILDMLEEDGKELEGIRHKAIDVFRYQGIFEAVEFLDELGYSGRLGLSETDLSKFRRIKGSVDSSVLWQLNGRLKSLLREAEGTIRSIAVAPGLGLASDEATPPEPNQPEVHIVAIEWVRNDRNKNVQIIANLTVLLDEAIVRARGTNLPPEKAAFTEFQRKALIDLLETALQMLKGPLVEKGLLKRLRDAAGEGAVGTVKKGVEVGAGFVLKRLWELLTQFISSL